MHSGDTGAIRLATDMRLRDLIKILDFCWMICGRILLIITADHGNDPTYTGTDHTREYVPFLAYSKKMDEGGVIMEKNTFAVIGATVTDNFGVKMPEGTIGHSILNELI